MVLFTALSAITVGVLASLAAAVPSTARPRGDSSYYGTCAADDFVAVTLIGAAGAQYSVEIPCSGEWYPIDNPLSISHIQTSAGPCTFTGIDGGSLTLATGTYSDFGPPQTVVGGYCGYEPY